MAKTQDVTESNLVENYDTIDFGPCVSYPQVFSDRLLSKVNNKKELEDNLFECPLCCKTYFKDDCDKFLHHTENCTE